MVTKKVTKPAATAAPDRSAVNYILARMLEPSTWAGLLTLGSAVATGGVAAWLNPQTLPVITAGIGLILNKEGS